MTTTPHTFEGNQKLPFTLGRYDIHTFGGEKENSDDNQDIDYRTIFEEMEKRINGLIKLK